MKINPKVCLTKKQEVIACTCGKTGITSALVIPQLPKGAKGEAFVFEYVHPLAYWSNAQGLIKAGRKYLEQLEAQVLAGLILTTYEHYSLLDKYELSAVEANAILCTASKDSLLELCCLAGLITEKNSYGTPALVLEWKDVRYAQTLDATLLSYIKTLRKEFIVPGDNQQDISQRKIQILNASSREGRVYKNGVQLLSARQSLADSEREFEHTFRAAKREIKELISTLRTKGTASKLLDFLGVVTAGRNLVAMDKNVRIMLQEKLHNLGIPEASRIANLIKTCDNPYDIFAKADEALDSASHSFSHQPKVRSIQEILAAKKANCVARDAQQSGGADTLQSEALSNDALIFGSDEDEDIEELLDYMPDGEASEGLTEEEDGLEDCATHFAKSLYGSKEF